jgi:predicted Zn-dependent protease
MSMPSDINLYQASLSDGRTAAASRVQIRLGEAGVEIMVPGERRTALVWPYGELRSGVPLHAGSGAVLLSRIPGGPQTLFVPDPGFSRRLLERARHLGAGRQRLMGLRPGIAAVAVVALAVGIVRYFDFHPSQTVARLLPQQTREAMGRNVVASLAGTVRRCETPQGRAALDRLTQRLVRAATDRDLAVRVVLLDWQLVNAFAAPGGQLILTRGLVQKAASPDEVAGVLAHEMGHALELHPETGLVRAMGLSAAAQLIFAGSSGTATNIGILLTQLRYTRVAEREADAHALRILEKAAISVKGFGDFFERVDPSLPARGTAPEKKDEPNKGPGLAKRIFESEILRTHPLTKDRLSAVRARPTYPATPALDDADWRALQSMCGAAPPQQRPGPPQASQQPGPPRPQTPAPPQKADPSDADREISEATQALAARPSDVEALQRRARAYARKGRHAEALADYAKAVELRPADANLHSARGGVHFALRQYELARVAYDEAIRLDAGHVAARNGRGNTLRLLKQYEAALADFDTLIAARPTFVYAYYNRGLIYVDMGRQEEAVRNFTSAIGIDKDYAGAYAQRGLLHERGGARELAIADFRAALAAPAPKYESGPWAHRTARERLRALGAEP